MRVVTLFEASLFSLMNGCGVAGDGACRSMLSSTKMMHIVGKEERAVRVIWSSYSKV